MLKRNLMIPFRIIFTIYEILNSVITFSNTLTKFYVVEIWRVYFYPEETIIDFSNYFL